MDQGAEEITVIISAAVEGCKAMLSKIKPWTPDLGLFCPFCENCTKYKGLALHLAHVCSHSQRTIALVF